MWRAGCLGSQSPPPAPPAPGGCPATLASCPAVPISLAGLAAHNAKALRSSFKCCRHRGWWEMRDSRWRHPCGGGGGGGLGRLLALPLPIVAPAAIPGARSAAPQRTSFLVWRASLRPSRATRRPQLSGASPAVPHPRAAWNGPHTAAAGHLPPPPDRRRHGLDTAAAHAQRGRPAVHGAARHAARAAWHPADRHVQRRLGADRRAR